MSDMPVRITREHSPDVVMDALIEDDYYKGDLVRELIEAIKNEHCEDCGCAFDPHPETVKAIAALEETE